MGNCIFCKIAKNEIKNYTIYEDDFIKVFLDANPWTEGHTLIIPKKHYENIFDIPEEELKKIIVIAKKLSVSYKNFFGCDINIVQSNGKYAQQEIPHFHMHLIPRFKSDGQKILFKINKEIQKKIPLTFEKIKSNMKI